jgi:hypothetical protein
LAILSSDHISIGRLGDLEFFSSTVPADGPVLGMHWMRDLWFTAFGVRICGSREPLQAEIPVHTLAAEEPFVGFEGEDDTLIVCTKFRVCRFLVPHVQFIGERVFATAVHGFGRFHGFLYVQFKKEVDFFTMDVVRPQDCDLFRAFTLKSDVEINLFACSGQAAAIVGASGRIDIFEFAGEFARIGAHHAREEVVAVAVLDGAIAYGTAQGNVCVLRRATDREFDVCESFAIGNRPTAMALRPRGELAIGTESGMVVNVGKAETPRKFDELYAVLARKVCSVGNFAKFFERLPRAGRYFTSRQQICDTAVLRAFKRMTRAEQKEILGNTRFGVDDALALVDRVINASDSQ